MPHIHDKVDLTVEVFVVYKNKVLLRKHDKYNIWLSVGGHVELDEDPNQAAVREVKEEVGLDVELYDDRIFKLENSNFQELISPQFMCRHRINSTHEHVVMIYFAKAKTDQIVEAEEEKSGGVRWLTPEELTELEDLSDNVKNYALKAVEILGT